MRNYLFRVSRDMKNKLNKIKGVLFDLDGTLLDTSVDLLQSLNLVLANHGLPPVSLSQKLRSVLGRGGRRIVNSVFQFSDTDPRLEVLTSEFNIVYQKQLHAQAQFFNGIPGVLMWLDRHYLPWGIVTNRAKDFTLPFPKHLDLLSKTSCVICGDDVKHPKPDPEPLLQAAQCLQLKPDDCIFIGDAEEDLIAGVKAQMPTVLAAYGFSAEEAQMKIMPDYIIHSPPELIRLLQD